MQPVTQYAKSGDVHIAYQAFGEGPLNVIFAPPAFSNVEHWWDGPDATRWLLRLASYARVVMFDKRGTGLSDRVGELPGLEQRMDDLRAVMTLDEVNAFDVSPDGRLIATDKGVRALVDGKAVLTFPPGSDPAPLLAFA